MPRSRSRSPHGRGKLLNRKCCQTVPNTISKIFAVKLNFLSFKFSKICYIYVHMVLFQFLQNEDEVDHGQKRGGKMAVGCARFFFHGIQL